MSLQVCLFNKDKGPTPSNPCHLSLKKLQECGVNTIIRLNEEEYDRTFFLQNGIDHVDIIFEDGTVPDEVILP